MLIDMANTIKSSLGSLKMFESVKSYEDQKVWELLV